MKWLSFLILFFMFGCSQKYYIDIFNSLEVKSSIPSKRLSLGVYDISIPHYLEESRISVTEKDKSVMKKIYIKDEYQPFLTQRLISYLHQKFPNGRVESYPWDFSQKPKNLLKLSIDELYVKDKKMYLDLRYKYNNHEEILHLEKNISDTDEKNLLKEFLTLYDTVLQKISQRL